jgi:ribosomal protein S18 acetylase RimI-like enzyme
MLVRAFSEDPVAVWACRGERLRASMLAGLYRARLRSMLVHREIWTTSDCATAAVWAPPDRWQTGLPRDAGLIRCLLHPSQLMRLPLLAIGFSTVQRKHPRDLPHWYLSLLGTDPSAQGRGLGSAALQPVLERCDLDGVGAYLETAKERNIDFYTRYGFRVTGELSLPRGPKMWLMWRDPRRQPQADTLASG